MSDEIAKLIQEHEALVASILDNQKGSFEERVEPFDDGGPELSEDALESYDMGGGKLVMPADADERLGRYWWVASSQCHKIELGWTKGFPPKTKCCPLRCRSWYIYLYVIVCHPAASEIIDDIQTCARRAAIAAGIAALIAGSSAAIATFKLTFYQCLINKGYAWAKDISVRITTDTQNGPWRRC